MEQAEGRFLYIADDPCLDFLNTLIRTPDGMVDLLQSVGDLADWLRCSSLAVPAIPESLLHKWEAGAQASRIIEQARKLREVLRGMVRKAAGNGRAPETAIREINTVLGRSTWHPQLLYRDKRYAYRFRWAVRSPRDLLVPVADAAARLLCEADFSLIRKCGNDACVLLFYDRTKNHRRHWCRMSVCGNRSKVAAYYKRKKAGTEGASRRRKQRPHRS